MWPGVCTYQIRDRIKTCKINYQTAFPVLLLCTNERISRTSLPCNSGKVAFTSRKVARVLLRMVIRNQSELPILYPLHLEWSPQINQETVLSYAGGWNGHKDTQQSCSRTVMQVFRLHQFDGDELKIFKCDFTGSEQTRARQSPKRPTFHPSSDEKEILVTYLEDVQAGFLTRALTEPLNTTVEQIRFELCDSHLHFSTIQEQKAV